MSRSDAPTRDTRQSLLDAACVLFAEKDFHQATVAEICERAGANIAAVNYYFRSKENLYVEAFRLAFERSLASHPSEGGVPPDVSAEERLRGRIVAATRRIMDPESHEFEMLHNEMANPTGLLWETIRELVEPLREGFAGDIRAILGPSATDTDVELCVRTVTALFRHFCLWERHLRFGKGPHWKPGPPPLDMNVEAMADHLYRFSLAGLERYRDRLNSREAPA